VDVNEASMCLIEGWCILRNADCGMRNFGHVYFAEILMRNVPQIIRCSNSAFHRFHVPHSAKYCFTFHDMQGKILSS